MGRMDSPVDVAEKRILSYGSRRGSSIAWLLLPQLLISQALSFLIKILIDYE